MKGAPTIFRFAVLAAGVALVLSGYPPRGALAAPAKPAAPTEPALLAGLDAYVDQAMRNWQTPGLAIAVVKDGKTVFAKGYGVRQLGGSAPVGADTVFAAASITKGFTAAAIAMLVAEDRLRWDDRVIDHLPGFQLRDPYVTREIRIRDLLSHRSGVARGEMLWYYSGFSRRDHCMLWAAADILTRNSVGRMPAYADRHDSTCNSPNAAASPTVADLI